MTSEQKNDKKYPRVTVGIFIENKAGKILLIRSPKWQEGLWLCPGGGVEYGELPAEAGIREAKEELGLDVVEPEFIQVVNGVDPKEFIYPGHFVGIDYKFKLADDDQILKIDSTEVLAVDWLSPEEIVKRDDIEITTLESVKKILEMRKGEKHGLFHHKCKDCEKHKHEAEEFKAGWQRALADYKNLQIETEKRRSEWAQLSERLILEEFIPVYDNFNKAFNVVNVQNVEDVENDKKWQNWKQGIEYIMKQYWKVLQDHGVEKVKTVGEMFDPCMHEAVSEEEGEEEGKILKEVEAGYTMKGKVIKVAKVVVAKMVKWFPL
jgi:molecular chaperone GrpE